MQTSIRTTAISVLEQMLQRLLAGRRLDEIVAELMQDHLIGEQLGGLIVDQQDVDLVVLGVMSVIQILAVEPHAKADNNCSVLTGFAR